MLTINDSVNMTQLPTRFSNIDNCPNKMILIILSGNGQILKQLATLLLIPFVVSLKNRNFKDGLPIFEEIKEVDTICFQFYSSPAI